MTQLTITDKLRNLNHDSDLQSDTDLDSIRNSCDVLNFVYFIITFVTCPIILLYVPLNIADVDGEPSDEVVSMNRVSHLCRHKRTFNVYFSITHL